MSNSKKARALSKKITTPAALTEAEAIDYIMTLRSMELNPATEPATISLGPWSAFIMIGALQVATRHPQMAPGQKVIIENIIDQLRPLFAGTPGEQLLMLGGIPEFDVPRGCKYPFGSHAPECGPGDHPGFGGKVQP